MNVCLGETAYVGYCEDTGWVSLVSGSTLPVWSELPDSIQQAWHAAAAAVVDVLR